MSKRLRSSLRHLDPVHRTGELDVDQCEIGQASAASVSASMPDDATPTIAKPELLEHFLDVAGDQRFVLDDQDRGLRSDCCPVGPLLLLSRP